MLYKLYWNQWCSDTQQLVTGLPEALAAPQQVSPLAVTFERWFLELKARSCPSIAELLCSAGMECPRVAACLFFCQFEYLYVFEGGSGSAKLFR